MLLPEIPTLTGGHPMSRILTVSGSPREVSRSSTLLGHVSDRLAAVGHTIDHLSLREIPADALLHADFGHRAIIDAAQRLEAADGVVIATPVYKAAYSGLLKTWLDLMPQYGLTRKAVLPLATGGSVAHALALDYALRPVLTSMNARHVVGGYLVLDQHILPPAPESAPDAPVDIHEDAVPALDGVVHAFLEALASTRLGAVA